LRLDFSKMLEGTKHDLAGKEGKIQRHLSQLGITSGGAEMRQLRGSR